MISKVSHDIWRGPRPQTKGQLFLLLSGGVQTFIDLEYGIYEIFHDDYYETFKFESPIDRIKLSWSDFMPPTYAQLIKALSVIEWARQKQAKIYIHCKFGRDRTGLLVLTYRISHDGWGLISAIKELHQYGFHWWPYFYWLPFVLISAFRLRKG